MNNEKSSANNILTYQRKFVEIETELGTLYLRYISLKDSDIFINYYENNIDSENFTKKFIINQIINNKISISQLDELNETQILSIIKEYLIKEDLNEYFNLLNINSYYDFKEELYAYLKYYYQPHKSVLKNIDKEMDKTQKLLKKINLMVPQLPNYYYDNLLNMINTSKNAIDTLKVFNKYKPQPIDFKIPLLANNLIENLQPLINEWSNLINSRLNLKTIQDRVTATLESSNEYFKKPMLKAMKCLNNYSWFIPLNMDYSTIFEVLSICESESSHKQAEINKLFIDYYLDDNCSELTKLIEIWNNSPIFKRRNKIFRDCINIMKNSNSSTNFSNLVVPTLIAQIDGIQREFMEINNLKIDYGKVKFLDDSKYKDGKVSWEDYFRDLTNGDEILDVMNDIFLNVLFQKTRPGEDYKTLIHFSRHKILHGENIRYGRKDYTIRCFIILDFLYELCIEN